MQTVSAAFTAEERDRTRSIASGMFVSWKKQTNLSTRTFTIGTSTIGGVHIIGVNPGAVGGPGIYSYFDESEYLLSLAWERSLNIPIGGMSTAMAEARLSNTSGRFTPRYIGGQSELFTAILPRRPFIINAGFHYDGIDQLLPQFSGILNRQPQIDFRSKDVRLVGADYVDFFNNRYLDQEVMFTGLRTDEVIEDLFQSLGMSTAQYELDTGINLIPFGLFEKGTRFSNIINDLVQAENGHLYQDEEGKFRFENREHWYTSPHNTVQRILLTGQVIDVQAPDDDHIINVVEVRSTVRQKQPRQQLFKLGAPVPVSAGSNELFVSFDDPVLFTEPPILTGNSNSDSTGASITLTLTNRDVFSKAAKYIFNASANGYLTDLVVFGRPARVVNDLYLRAQDDSSVTAYEERNYSIDNPFIQTESWANSYAQMILQDFSAPENLQRIQIRAIPELQLGDLVSWQGRYWRVFEIRTNLSPELGFVQDLTLLQRTIVTYFRIGISTIAGSDKIAP